ncbi:MAG: hypothetical protein AAGF57_09990, partial [Pseudomonadota bacterium]
MNLICIKYLAIVEFESGANAVHPLRRTQCHYFHVGCGFSGVLVNPTLIQDMTELHRNTFPTIISCATFWV